MNRRVRDSGVTWIGDIPEGWIVEPFRRLFRESKEINGPTPVGPMLSISGYRGVEEKVYESESLIRDNDQLENYRVVRPGQLAVNTMWLNYAGLGVSQLLGHVSPAYRAYWISKRLDGRYAHHLMRSSIYVQGYTALLTGIRPNSLQMNRADLMAFPVVVPPLDEQRAIADYLDRETAQIDAFIAKNEELIALLTERRAASIDGIFERLDARPTRLKYCASIQTGVTLGGDGDPADPEWPYLRVANVQVGRVDLGEIKTIRVSEARARQSMLSGGDVLMTEGGDRDKLGRGALWSGEVEPMLHQNHVFAVKVRPNLDARFLMRWLDASPSRRYFETTAVQTTNLASTNKTLVGNLPLPVCGVEVQIKLVAELDQRLGKLDEAVAVAGRSIELARERRAALISAAVTGKIDVGVAE